MSAAIGANHDAAIAAVLEDVDVVPPIAVVEVPAVAGPLVAGVPVW